MGGEVNKFRANTIFKKVESFEVVKETGKQIVYAYHGFPDNRRYERRETKETSDHKWFDTWDEGKAWLLDRFQEKVERARRNLELANSQLGNIKGLKP